MTNSEIIKLVEEIPIETVEQDLAVNKVIDALINSEKSNKWIPCTEREPEREYEAQMRGYYITTNAYGSVNLTKYEFEGGGLGFGWGSDIMIVAWMPLPEPYKTESEDK